MSAQINERVEQERMRALYATYQHTLPMSLVFAVVWAWISYPFVELLPLLVWLAAMVLVVAIRIVLCQRHYQKRNWRREPAKLEFQFALGCGLSGGLWGAGAWLLLPELPPVQHAVTIVLIFGIAAGAFISMVTSPKSYNAFCWPMLLPTLGSMALNPDSRTMALLLLGFSVIFISATFRRMHEVVIKGLRGLIESEMLVEELKAANQKVTLLSKLDPLTGIANRRRFDEALKEHWRLQARAGKPLSLAMIDVDAFKPFNDNYGHPKGDVVLRDVAKLIQDQTRRPGDLAARFGGEEFAVLLPDTDAEGAVQVAEAIHDCLHAKEIPHAHSPVCANLTVSIGLACVVPDNHNSLQALLEQADKAMYQAKKKGRNRTCIAGQESLPAQTD